MSKEIAGCVFISSEGSFPSKRLHQLAKTFMLQHCDKLNIERVKFEDNIFLDHIADFVSCLSEVV